MNKRILIAGIGNRLMLDDGFGSYVAEELAKEKLPKNIDVVDYGISAMSLLHDLSEYDMVIVIDVVKHENPPGTIYKIHVTPEDVISIQPIDATTFFHISYHEIDIERLLAMAKAINTLPSEVYIIGIEPQKIDHGIGLSSILSQKIECVKKLILSLL